MYFVVFRDEDRYRMYYRGQNIFNVDGTKYIIEERGVWCYDESTDGIHWERPNLGLWEFQGSKENNIIMGDHWQDNFYVFKDTNPNCPPEARYKGLEGRHDLFSLHCYISAEGIHFTYPALPVSRWSWKLPCGTVICILFSSNNKFWACCIFEHALADICGSCKECWLSPTVSRLCRYFAGHKTPPYK